MTAVEAVRQWLANGARQDDPVLAQCGATKVERGGAYACAEWTRDDESLSIRAVSQAISGTWVEWRYRCSGYEESLWLLRAAEFRAHKSMPRLEHHLARLTESA